MTTRSRSLGLVPSDVPVRMPDSQPSSPGQALVGTAPANPADPVQLNWATVGGGGGGAGTVTSVGLSTSGLFTVSSSPVTTTGTLGLTWQSAAPNSFLAGPAVAGAGAHPVFRGLVAADMPLLNNLTLSGTTSGAVTINTSATAGTWSLTLPTSGGTAGQVLTTNGAGVTTWSNPVVADGDKGDIVVSGTGATWVVEANAVTYAKMQNVVNAQRVLGSGTASSPVAEISASTVMDWLGTPAQGQLAYRSATGWTLLGPGTAGQVLTTQGPAANPSWVTPAGVTDGDKGDITVSGSGATWTIDNSVVTYAKIQNVATNRILGRATTGAGVVEELTPTQALDWLGTPAQGQIMYRGATSWTLLGPGTAGQVLQTGGVGANPSWASVAVTDGDKGDITVSGTGGTWTIDNLAVTYGKIQNVVGAQRVLGSATAGGSVSELSASTVLDWLGTAAQGQIAFRGATGWSLLAPGTAGQILQTGGAGANPSWISAGVSDGDKGDITVSATGATWTIDNSAVTYAKMQNVVSAQRLLGSATAAAAPSEIGISTALDWLGTPAQGQIAYRSNTGWALLAPGTSGQVLKTNGAGSAPTWTTPASSLKGSIDPVTVAAPTTPVAGDYYFASNATAGVAGASWTGIAGRTVNTGDMLIWDGAKWDVIPATTSAAGANKQIQFNDGGVRAGAVGAEWDKGSTTLGITGTVSWLSGTTTIGRISATATKLNISALSTHSVDFFSDGKLRATIGDPSTSAFPFSVAPVVGETGFIVDYKDNVVATSGGVTSGVNRSADLLYIPVCDTAPTGVPSHYVNRVPIVLCLADKKLYTYISMAVGWEAVQ